MVMAARAVRDRCRITTVTDIALSCSLYTAYMHQTGNVAVKQRCDAKGCDEFSVCVQVSFRGE